MERAGAMTGGSGDTTVPVESVQRRAPSWSHVNEFLSDISLPALDRLLKAGTPRTVRRGEVCFGSADIPGRGGILVEGLARVYLEAADGRKLVVRYARPGSTVGIVFSLQGRAAPANVQAVTDSVILEIPPREIELMAHEDAEFAWALAVEVGRRLLDTIESLADASFATVRGRLARHLLDLADGVDGSGRLVVVATHQQLADSIASVREVVARQLGDLRDEGLVEVDRGLVTILEPERLAALAGQWLQRRR